MNLLGGAEESQAVEKLKTNASLQPLQGNITALHNPELLVDETPLNKRPRRK